MRVLDARFLRTAPDKSFWPPEGPPELAFAGRSNVGKSTMINALCGRRKLARASNTPGRTRALNFFDVRVEDGDERREVRLADLPGYGFARVSKDERGRWQSMVRTYLTDRAPLAAIVSIVDAAVGPTEDDEQLLDFLSEGRPDILLVATKLDKIKKSDKKPRLKALAEQLALPREAVVGFSAKDGTGIEEVWEALLSVLPKVPTPSP